MSRLNQHCFALHIPSFDLLSPLSATSFVLTDKVLIHRITGVLRLRQGDTVILFDDQFHAYAVIETPRDKKSLVLLIAQKEAHTILLPKIHWLLPLLKREAFEQALYTLTELGATSIQPLITTKSRRSWGSEKDYARARSLMRAAAEQAKQFVLPDLAPVTSLTDWYPAKEMQSRVFFDGEGLPLKEVLNTLVSSRSVLACAGPEGDLTKDEKERLKAEGFTFCALTPTVLRAQQAVAVGLGVLRSYLS